jgi:hypothetical protein
MRKPASANAGIGRRDRTTPNSTPVGMMAKWKIKELIGIIFYEK